MSSFTEECDELEERRVDLALAEKLLELPITVHEKLLDVKKQLSGLSQIYALYREQSVSHLDSVVMFMLFDVLGQDNVFCHVTSSFFPCLIKVGI